jgi:glycosyltransferase involved in cell wall biosynthesis
LAADLGADVIHAHWATWPLVAACRAKKITGLPTGIAVHAYDLYLSDVDALASRLTEVDYIVVNNEYNREWIRAHLPADVVAKTHVIHDSVAVPETAPDEGERSSNLILAVGRLVPFKGFDVLLRALRILRDRSVAFHAVIVGDGPSRRNLARLAKDLVLANCISFTGALPNLAVRELMKKATVLVVPSIEPAAGSHDGLPYVIPEALSLRLPVVATNVAAIGEAIRDHDTGLLVPPEDAARLAEAIAAILAQPELRTRVVRGGAALVRERFNEERNIDRLVALQCDLLDARRRD